MRRFGARLARVLFASPFIISGVAHFASTDSFTKIIPPYLPWHRELVWISGACEIVLALLLFVPRYSRLAAWGIVALLVAIFPANIYLYQHQELLPAHPLVHLARLPLQGVLIYWAWLYTRPRKDAAVGGEIG